MLEKEFEYFNKHKDELRQKYLGRHIVISENSVCGVYSSDEEAYLEAIKSIKPGQFMIKFITASDEDAVQRFTSLVYV